MSALQPQLDKNLQYKWYPVYFLSPDITWGTPFTAQTEGPEKGQKYTNMTLTLSQDMFFFLPNLPVWSVSSWKHKDKAVLNHSVPTWHIWNHSMKMGRIFFCHPIINIFFQTSDIWVRKDRNLNHLEEENRVNYSLLCHILQSVRTTCYFPPGFRKLHFLLTLYPPWLPSTFPSDSPFLLWFWCIVISLGHCGIGVSGCKKKKLQRCEASGGADLYYFPAFLVDGLGWVWRKTGKLLNLQEGGQESLSQWLLFGGQRDSAKSALTRL